MVGNDTTTRIFNAYIESIFLYNSELWTLTTKHINIDVLHNYKTLLSHHKTRQNEKCRPLQEHKHRTVEQNHKEGTTKLDMPLYTDPQRHTSKTSPTNAQLGDQNQCEKTLAQTM